MALNLFDVSENIANTQNETITSNSDESLEACHTTPYGYVYMTTNKVNGMRYIGQKKSPTFVKRYVGSGSALLDAIAEFGKKAFTTEVLEWCYSMEDLDNREVFWIEHYDAVNRDDFYNIYCKGHNTTGDGYSESVSKIRKSTIDKKGKTFWVNNGTKERLVTESEYTELLKTNPEFKKGRMDDIVYMRKDGQSFRVHSHDVDEYLKRGFELGKSDDICKNISKARQHCLWKYEDIVCGSAKELCEYLKNHGYPDIVKSTVVNLGNGINVRTYPTLWNRIIREYKD